MGGSGRGRGFGLSSVVSCLGTGLFAIVTIDLTGELSKCSRDDAAACRVFE